MAAYFFMWDPKQDPHSFKDFERIQREAMAGRPYVRRWDLSLKKAAPRRRGNPSAYGQQGQRGVC